MLLAALGSEFRRVRVSVASPMKSLGGKQAMWPALMGMESVCCVVAAELRRRTVSEFEQSAS